MTMKSYNCFVNFKNSIEDEKERTLTLPVTIANSFCMACAHAEKIASTGSEIGIITSIKVELVIGDMPTLHQH